MAWRRIQDSNLIRSALLSWHDNGGGSLVLVGFDGSPASEHALAYGNGVAQRLGGRLLVSYVKRSTMTHAVLASLGMCTFGPTFVARTPSALGRRAGVEDDEILRLVRRAEEVLGGHAVPWVFECRTGRVAESLSDMAQEYRADVVVVGKPRHRIRSAARRTSHHCEQPVVTVP
jgi:nucleotide-binding universal stress UspA family protein